MGAQSYGRLRERAHASLAQVLVVFQSSTRASRLLNQAGLYTVMGPRMACNRTAERLVSAYVCHTRIVSLRNHRQTVEFA